MLPIVINLMSWRWGKCHTCDIHTWHQNDMHIISWWYHYEIIIILSLSSYYWIHEDDFLILYPFMRISIFAFYKVFKYCNTIMMPKVEDIFTTILISWYHKIFILRQQWPPTPLAIFAIYRYKMSPTSSLSVRLSIIFIFYLVKRSLSEIFQMA